MAFIPTDVAARDTLAVTHQDSTPEQMSMMSRFNSDGKGPKFYPIAAIPESRLTKSDIQALVKYRCCHHIFPNRA